jgi:hypothetical protein
MDLVHHAACVVNEALRQIEQREFFRVGTTPISASGSLLLGSFRLRAPSAHLAARQGAEQPELRDAERAQLGLVRADRADHPLAQACAVSSASRSEAMPASCHTSAGVVERHADEA